MQNGAKKPKQPNGGKAGKIIPFTNGGVSRVAKSAAVGQDRMPVQPAPKKADPSEDIAALEKLSGQQLVEAATYSAHPEVRKKALGKLSQDKYALQSIVLQTPYPDTESDAGNCLKALAAAQSSGVKTE